MHEQFLVLSVIWLFVLLVLIVHLWRKRHEMIGITVTYLVFLAAGYWLQGATYSLPWYEPMYPPETILSGFQMSLIALISLAVGVIVVAPFLRNLHRRITPTATSRKTGEAVSRETLYKITWVYIASGLLVYLVVAVVLGDIPTLGAFLGGIQRLYHVGILFLIWLTFTEVPLKRTRLLIIGLLVFIWPLFTITRDGFLGFGLIPTTLLFIFYSYQFLRARTVLIILPLVLYLGMSIIMTYFGQRNEIRAVAWSSADTDTRINTVADTFTTGFRGFDIHDSAQLSVFDLRFSLNWYTGRGIERLSSNLVDYAHGETIRDAFLMILPRAIWVDKPIVAGGQATLNQYTGIYLYGNTSAALGQVLEFYVNFGVPGVITAFIVLGLLMTSIDRKASDLLRSADFARAAVWIAPVFGIFEDNLINVIGGAFSTLLAVIIFNQFLIVVLLSKQRRLGGTRGSTVNHAEPPIVA